MPATATPSKPRRISVAKDYPLLMGAGTLYLARGLATRRQKASDTERSQRMRRVWGEKAKLLHEAFPKHFPSTGVSDRHLTELLSRPKWDEVQARTFIVDLAFSDPFAPWQIEYDQDEFHEVLELIATTVGLSRDVVEEIHRIQKEALKAHRHVDFGKIALFGLGGAVVMAAGGLMLAPALGGALGAGAGFGGIAATNYGLALLGGGSVAAGGAGVAGGMILVTGVAATTGFVGATGAQVMLQMGARAAKAELIKLQTNYKAALLHSDLQHAKARQVAKDLAAQQTAFEKELAQERKLNDKNSQRLKDLEDTLEAIKDARSWMSKQAA